MVGLGWGGASDVFHVLNADFRMIIILNQFLILGPNNLDYLRKTFYFQRRACFFFFFSLLFTRCVFWVIFIFLGNTTENLLFLVSLAQRLTVARATTA